MNVVGVIPARWGSTRLPGKSLVEICGRPLIAWVIESASRATRLDSLVVATDDARIAGVAEGAGCRAVMTRTDHPSGTDRVAEAVDAVDADVIVNIQGDEPLVEGALIDSLADVLLSDTQWDMATAATPITREEDLVNPSVVKVVFDRNGGALYFSRSVIPYDRDADATAGKVPYWWHMGLYAYRRSFLSRLVATPPCMLEKAEKLEQLRALDIGGRMKVLTTTHRAAGVDTPEDVAYVESLIRGEQPS